MPPRKSRNLPTNAIGRPSSRRVNQSRPSKKRSQSDQFDNEENTPIIIPSRKRRKGNSENTSTPTPSHNHIHNHIHNTDVNYHPVNDFLPTLEATIKQVSKKTIQKSWKSLNESSRESISEIINSCLPTVLASVQIRSGERRALAQEHLSKLIRIINRHMMRTLVPIKLKQPYLFELEKLITYNDNLESQLVPNVEQISDLRKQVQKETKLLQQDQERLNHYEQGSKAIEIKDKVLQQDKLHNKIKETMQGEKLPIDDELCKQHIKIELSDATMIEQDLYSNEEVSDMFANLGAHLSQINEQTYPLDKVSREISGASELLHRLSEQLGVSITL